MEYISVNDELLELKKRVRALGKVDVQIEKVGNGNMAAFSLTYRDNKENAPKTTFFWRHELEEFYKRMELKQRSH